MATGSKKRPDHPWLSALVAEERADEAAAMLWGSGALGVEVKDRETLDAPGPGCALVTGYFASKRSLAPARRRLQATMPAELRSGALRDEGWRDSWKKHFRPIAVGERLVVVCPWHSKKRRSSRMPLIIDPGQAFGTGGHATTLLILEELDVMSRKGLPSPVLDVGCGSGVLSIAALRLGAQRCTAIDNDPEAVEAARMNARLNGVEARIDVRRGTAASVRRSFPLVLANLELRIFRTEAERIARRVAPGGTLLISGLLKGQERDAQALFPDLRRVKMNERDGWVMLKLAR